MAESQYVETYDGQEVQQQDFNLIGGVSGLADDRVFSELLRLQPYDGTNVYKGVVPYSTTSWSRTRPSYQPAVVPSGNPDGSVTVNPFRAVIGSRNLQGGAPPTNPVGDTDALAAWRDMRSGIFVGSASTLTQEIQLAANSSGNPRWDLVYAQISVDAGQNSVSRRVKSPSVGSLSTESVPQYNGCPVIVAVVTGTPGATPTPPVVPADAAGNYCIPLALVRVPNGFGSTTTIATGDIRAYTLAHDGSSSTSDFRDLASGPKIRPATGNNDASGTYAQRGFPWAAATAGARPGPFMSPDWLGGEMIMVELDLDAGSSSGWSHINGDIVDGSVDWRKRIFPLVVCQASGNNFAQDPTGSTTVRLPLASLAVTNVFNVGNSCGVDGVLGANTSSVTIQENANNPGVASGATVGLYVSQTDGTLRAYISGTPTCRLFFFILASGQVPNL